MHSLLDGARISIDNEEKFQDIERCAGCAGNVSEKNQKNHEMKKCLNIKILNKLNDQPKSYLGTIGIISLLIVLTFYIIFLLSSASIKK